MGTAPQRERSGRPKVTRGLHGRSHKSHFCVEIYRENAGRIARGQRFLQAFAVEMHMDMSQEPFCVEIYRDATPVLCEPAQSKCTSTFHKSHFVSGKMPNGTDTTSIEHWALTPTVRTPQCGHTVWGIMFLDIWCV